jgi:type II secretory pathway component GspD/PulD (secretin)
MKQVKGCIELIKINPSATPNLFDIEFRDAPIRDVVDSLSALTKTTYTLAPHITGVVYMKITAANIDKILSSMCSSSNPNLFMRDTTHPLHPQEQSNEIIFTKSLIPSLPMKLKIIVAKPIKCQPIEERCVSVTVQNTPIRDALANFCGALSINFSLSPSVQGILNVSFENQPFDTAFRRLMLSGPIPMTYNKEGNLYIIKPRAI